MGFDYDLPESSYLLSADILLGLLWVQRMQEVCLVLALSVRYSRIVYISLFQDGDS